MAKLESRAEWKGGMEYLISLGEHTLTIDAPVRYGGKNNGPKPTYMLLAGLMGCTGMDVASLFKKMHIPVEKIVMNSCADVADEDPHVFKSIELQYFFEGEQDLEKYTDKLVKAIYLSKEKYCCVSIMLNKSCPIWISAYVNGTQINLQTS